MQTEDHHDFKLQHQYEAVIRSLSGQSNIKIRDWQLFVANQPFGMMAPHLNLLDIKESWVHPRGIVDGIALRLRYSDHALHHTLSPDGMIESFVFEILEQIRVESLCPDHLKGSRENIQVQFLAWIQRFMSNGGIEGSIGLLLLSIFSTVWIRLNHSAVPQLMQDIVETTRAGLAIEMGPILVQLKSSRNDQATFAKHAVQITKLIQHLISDEYARYPSIRTRNKPNVSSLLKIEWIPPNTTNQSSDNQGEIGSQRNGKEYLKKSLSEYHVFDAEFDMELEAKKNIRHAQLIIYQEQLTEEVAKFNIPWARLTRLYKQLFKTGMAKKWQTLEAEGQIDRRYLIRAATSPLQSMLYRHPLSSMETNGRVTILIDCSGSMKEQRLKIASHVDSLVRVLELANIQTEVLGYSTVTWQGGRPLKKWRKNGQPPNPGRLNERVHWIFKDVQTSWRKARPGIAALLRSEIYTESIDGEAILWAVERLKKADTGLSKNKKLILFSDGCPMDRATIEANHENFLKDHLIHAIEWAEHIPNLEIWGCGIGEELRSIFQRRLSWNPIEENPSIQLIKWAEELKWSQTN